MFYQYISVSALLHSPGGRICLVDAHFEVGCQSQKLSLHFGERYKAGRAGKVRCGKINSTI